MIDGGLLKTSRYRVVFAIPPVFGYLSTGSELYNTTRYLEYYADSVDFPGVGLLAHEVLRYGYGATEKKPIAPTFQDVMITFYNDSQGMNFNFFDQWMACITNFNMSGGISGGTTAAEPYELFYKDDYAVTGWVTTIDTNGNDVATYAYRQMYPINIPNMKLGWSLIQDVQRVTVFFTFMDKYLDTTQAGTLVNNLSSTSSGDSNMGNPQ